MNPMKTAALVMLGLMTALTVLAPTAIAEDPPVGPEAAATCPPVWFDSNGNPHVDPTCIGPVFDNRT